MMKEKILQDLGVNPTEIDIRYISYVTNIPTTQIQSWVEESQQTNIGSKECLIVGSRKPKVIKSAKIKIETPQNIIDQTLNQQEEQKEVNNSQTQQNLNKLFQKELKTKEKNQSQMNKEMLNQQINEELNIKILKM